MSQIAGRRPDNIFNISRDVDNGKLYEQWLPDQTLGFQ